MNKVPTPLARYHRILAAVSEYPGGLNLGSLVHAVDLPRSSVHRTAASLCAVGYLRLTDEGLYVFGPALTELLRRSLVASSQHYSFQPALQFLVNELRETAFFARLAENRIELVEVATPSSIDHAYVHPGTGERPVDTCSSSKAILAFAEQDVIKNMFASSGLGADDGNDFQDFHDSLLKVKRDGYAICDGEIDEGVFSVACPVVVGDMEGLFSIGVVGPRGRMKQMKLEKIVRVVSVAATRAANSLAETVKSA